MAYTFFPKSVKEIDKILKFPPIVKQEISSVFAYLSHKKFQTPQPINVDPNISTLINVVRGLQGSVDLTKVKRESKIKNLKLKFGNGSLGGRGVQNKGNLFENQYAKAIEKYNAGDKIEAPFIKSIEDLYKTYKLKKYPKLNVFEAGALNVKRPITYGNQIVIKAQGQVGLNLGPIVTDLTLKDKEGTAGKPIVYLSLKLGGTTTFFNTGVRTVLTPEEIKSNQIKNPQGNRLLKMFGIDKKMFADVFNGKLKSGVIKNVWPTMNGNAKKALENFLQSGIGYGYHVIHKLGTCIKSIKVDERYMKEAARPLSLRIFYGGKTGTGKRVDMEIMTPKYALKLNIRDTQGKDGYPTRMMADFTYK